MPDAALPILHLGPTDFVVRSNVSLCASVPSTRWGLLGCDLPVRLPQLESAGDASIDSPGRRLYRASAYDCRELAARPDELEQYLASLDEALARSRPRAPQRLRASDLLSFSLYAEFGEPDEDGWREGFGPNAGDERALRFTLHTLRAPPSSQLRPLVLDPTLARTQEDDEEEPLFGSRCLQSGEQLFVDEFDFLPDAQGEEQWAPSRRLVIARADMLRAFEPVMLRLIHCLEALRVVVERHEAKLMPAEPRRTPARP